MSSTGLRNPLSSMFVECVLEVLQSSVLSQIGQVRLLQGLGLRGFSNYRSLQSIHVPATKFFPLLRREGFGAVLFMNARQIAVPVASVFMGEARRTAWSIDHQNFSRWVAAVALGCGLYGASRQIEQAVERFVGLDCRNLGGGRLASHRVPHPPLKPRPARALALAGDREGGRWGSRPIRGRRLPQQNAADTCAKMRRTADGERIDVEWCLLEPSGVVGDEHERAETDLAALGQSSA